MPILNDGQVLNREEYETNMTIANAVQLGTLVVKKIAGNEVSTSLGGGHLTQVEIADLLAAKIRTHLTSTVKFVEEVS